jgi:hypothetical protein
MKPMTKRLTLAIPLFIGSCTSMPTGPTVLVLQGTDKSFTQFGRDDTVCRTFAGLQTKGVPPDQAAIRSGLKSSRGGSAPVAGPDSTGEYGETTQELYNIAYIQCMYEQGHRVPVPGNVLFEDRQQTYPPPPPPTPDEREP